MIVKLFNHAHVLYQRSGIDDELPNDAICGCIDSGGTICLRQGDADIVINKESIDELCELLRTLKRLAPWIARLKSCPGACRAGLHSRVASRGSVVSAAHGKTSTASGEPAPIGQILRLARLAPSHQCSPTRETDPARSAEGEMPSDGGSSHHTGTPLGAGCALSMDGAQ